MTDQGLPDQVLALLEPEIPQPLTDRDLKVQRGMFRALALAHLGDYTPANQQIQQARQLCPEWSCESAGRLARISGAVLVDEDRLDEAAEYFLTSMRIAQHHKDRFLEVSAQLNLGVTAMGKEHFDESIDWSDRAQATAREIGAELDAEKALGNIGWAHYKMGDFEKALDNFQAAVQAAKQLDAVKDETIWLNDIGLVYFQTNQLGLAEDYYRRSLDLATQARNADLILASLNALAFLSLRNGNLERAAVFSRDAFDRAHQLKDRADELYALLVNAEIEAHSSNHGNAEKLLGEIAQDPASDTSLRWEAQNSLAQLLESENRTAAADRAYRETIATIEHARSAIQHEDFRLPFLANAAHLYDDYIHFLVKQGKPFEALQQADYSRAQTLAEGLRVGHERAPTRDAAFKPQQLAAKMKSAILFYWLGPEHAFLWTITPGQIHLTALSPTSEIEDKVTRYNKALLSARDPLATGNADGAELYRMLVEPAQPFLASSSRVIIVPDGSLNTLNFESLIASDPKPHYWIEDATIQTAASLRLLSAAKPPGIRPSKLLLIGDPVSEDKSYGKLANASTEITNVEKHFPPGARVLYTREQATRAAFLSSHPEQFSFIHFVAHGTASRLTPLESGVVLSAVPGEASSKLYARDIVARPLRAQLVTVSTCFGSGTRYYTGEGLVGLSWAFLRAGAHQVIAALWEVSDTSTPALMDSMYDELQKGRTPEIALHTAKLRMLHSDSIFRKPYYWATFQLYVGP